MVGESEAGARVKASVIICAHTEERWPYLLEAVASVEAQTHTAHEIIVVIDHNASLYERAVAGIDTARVVSNRDTPGLGGARNSGLEEATGDVVVFLDDDAAASPHWLASFADAYQGADILGWSVAASCPSGSTTAPAGIRRSSTGRSGVRTSACRRDPAKFGI